MLVILIKMNFPGFVLLVGLLAVVESTVFSWANHEKPEMQDGSKQERHARTVSCIKLFAVNGKPPIFPTANTEEICQKAAVSIVAAEFATLFDTSLGIPRYSIYALDPAKVGGIGTVGRSDNWHQTAGITLQGSNAMYANQPGPIKYHKGHVAPFNILSYSAGSGLASFAYTNAVPQVAHSNISPWKTYEGRIVKYAQKCALQGGTIYLITGISEVIVSQAGATVTAKKQPISQSFPSHVPSITQKIAIPNSMWTAGCCVNAAGNVLGAFAVIGNNLPKGSNTVFSLSVAEVQQFIRDGANDQTIDFFPGNAGCDAIANKVVL